MIRACHTLSLFLLLPGCHLFSSGAIDQACQDRPAACGLGGDGDGDGVGDDTAGTTDDTGAGEPVEFDSLEPAFGSNGGGTEVFISGEGLESIVDLRFGDQPAQITDSSEEGITVRTPGSSDEGLVAVHLRTQTGTDEGGLVIPDAFYFHGDQTGNLRFLGLFETFEPITDGATDPLVPSALAFVIEGLADEPYAFLGGAGVERCSNGDLRQLGEIDAADFVDLGLSELTLEHPGGTLLLDWVGATDSFESALGDEEFYVEGGDYHVGPIVFEGADFEIENVVIPPTTVDLTAFEGLPLDSITEFTVAPNPQIAWSMDGKTSSSRIVVQMTLVSPTENATVSCLANDDGHFRVDGDLWGQWEAGRNVEVRIARVDETETTWTSDNGTSRWLALNWQVLLGTSLGEGPEEDDDAPADESESK